MPKPCFRISVFSNSEVADCFPVHKRSCWATTFPATRLITTVNASAAISGNYFTPNRGRVLEAFGFVFFSESPLEACAGHKRTAVCFGSSGGAGAEAVTERRDSAGLEAGSAATAARSQRAATM